MFGFANVAHEFNFGAVLLFLWKFSFGLVGLILYVLFCRFGLVELVL